MTVANLSPRELATLTHVVATFVPDADAAVVARTIVRELEAVGRPKLVADLRLFLGVIDSAALNLALAGRPLPFSRMERDRRERYLLSWADSAAPLRRKAFQAVKRASLFFAYASAEAGADRLWPLIGYERPPLLPLPDDPTALLSRSTRDGETIEADACVVGSGAGGSVVAAELARAGRTLVRERFALPRMLDEHLAFYRGLLAARPAAAPAQPAAAP